ncbi:capsule biosynthesis GfcC D2 domain-containing protein [Idiomarina sp.]|uniref:capsule biosynthesis GfcC D2 domain-containing protein n=1 Tax=Idiomarina sp. TaxID=1874361 RepID=UPI0026372E3E|nr:capsule biosynthesis GfcC D2 domain-containing protein [Idiomarina sp.]
MSITFYAKKIITATLLLTSTTVLAQSNQLTIERPNQEPVTYQLPDQIRMGDAISRSLPNKNIYWPAARLGSKHLQTELERERRKVLMRLEDLQADAKRRNEDALLGAATQLYKQIEQLPLKAGYYLGIPWESIRIDLESNPKLNEEGVNSSHFKLTVNRYPTFYRVLGLTNAPESRVFPAPTQSTQLKDLLSSLQISPVADKGHVWHIAMNGEVSRQPAASYNEKQASECYPHNRKAPLQLSVTQQCFPDSTVKAGAIIFIGFSKSKLPEPFKNINEHIAQILKHHNYAQN